MIADGMYPTLGRRKVGSLLPMKEPQVGGRLLGLSEGLLALLTGLVGYRARLVINITIFLSS